MLRPSAVEGQDEVFSESNIESALTYNFTYDDITEELSGIVYEGDAMDDIMVGDVSLLVSDSDNRTAVWSDASEESGDAAAAVRFELHFERASAAVFVAQGKDETRGVTYSVVATQPDSFVATEVDASGATTVTVGQRYHAPVEKSFFQKYGTYGLMGGLFLLNIGMRYFTGQGGLGGGAPTAEGEEAEGEGEGEQAAVADASAAPAKSTSTGTKKTQ